MTDLPLTGPKNDEKEGRKRLYPYNSVVGFHVVHYSCQQSFI